MWVADDLVLLELQKCASTRIAAIIEDLYGGHRVGKHDRFVDDPAGRTFIGSVRDPWSWYVSLWAFGCEGKGQVHGRTTGSTSALRAARMAKRTYGPSWSAARGGLAWYRGNRTRAPERWAELYEDADDVEAFRAWLGLVLDPANAYQLDLRYGASHLPAVAGLMTFWYVWLYADDEERVLASPVRSADDVLSLDRETNRCDHIVRVDHLADDLHRALAAARGDDDGLRAALARLAGERVNSSQHRPTAAYYDDAAIDAVARSEEALITKHRFAPPEPTASPG